MMKPADRAVVSNIIIDALRVDDIPRCVEIEKELFTSEEPWTAQAFRHELGSTFNTYVAARDKSLLVGYAGVKILPASNNEPAIAEIHNVAVTESHQGKGIGRLLVDELLRLVDTQRAQTFLEVRVDNEVAKKLYQSLGFSIIGVREKYYQPAGVDAYSMCREVQ